MKMIIDIDRLLLHKYDSELITLKKGDECLVILTDGYTGKFVVLDGNYLGNRKFFMSDIDDQDRVEDGTYIIEGYVSYQELGWFFADALQDSLNKEESWTN